MSNNAPITFTYGTLPEGFCPAGWQEAFNEFSALLSGSLPGTYNTFNYGNSVPDVSDRDKPWFRLDNSGYGDRWYVYNNGDWLSPHPTPAASSEVRLWTGSLADLATYDGGDSDPAGAASGPMWNEATEFQARMPLGVGTLPSTTAVAVLGTGGEETHTITAAESGMNNHTHAYGLSFASTGDAQLLMASSVAIPSTDGYHLDGNTDGSQSGQTVATTSANLRTLTPTVPSSPVTTAHNTMPPYVGVYFIRRTSRIFYKTT